MAVKIKRTFRLKEIFLCLFVTVVALPTSLCQLSVDDVTFLGYVTPSSDVSDLSALIQVTVTAFFFVTDDGVRALYYKTFYGQNCCRVEIS
jgi:hypothetical protein